MAKHRLSDTHLKKISILDHVNLDINYDYGLIDKMPHKECFKVKIAAVKSVHDFPGETYGEKINLIKQKIMDKAKIDSAYDFEKDPELAGVLIPHKERLKKRIMQLR